MESHPPVINHGGKGTGVFLLIVVCVGLTYHRGQVKISSVSMLLLYAKRWEKTDVTPSCFTLVPDSSFDGHVEKWMDHGIPQQRVSPHRQIH